jgi:hypothetical protein
MLDPGNAQHMATYPALSFPKHNTPSPQRWKGLHLRHKWKPRAHNATHKGDPTKQKGTTTLSTSPIPLPQTTAITCLSEPAPTNQLATLSQDQQAKRARHTQDALPGTRKRTRSQTESQQHTPLTQIIDTVALNSQIVIQPTELQPTNSQPNKHTTRSQITSRNHQPTELNLQTVSQTNAPHAHKSLATTTMQHKRSHKLSLLPPSISTSSTR